MVDLKQIKLLDNSGIVSVCRTQDGTLQDTMDRLYTNSLPYGEYTELLQGLDSNEYETQDEQTNLSPETDILVVTYSVYSDYSGGMVERANYSALLELCQAGTDKRFYKLYGDYGTTGLAVNVSLQNPAVWETLNGLAEYPLVDEELYSLMQVNAEIEAYEEGDKTVFVSIIESNFEGVTFASVELDDIKKLFATCQDRTGEYYEIEEGGTAYINIDRLTKNLTVDDVRKIPNIEIRLDDGETLDDFIDYYKNERQGQTKLEY